MSVKYRIQKALPTGGKAGKGHNKTSTIQVVKDNLIVKQFRYRIDSIESLAAAQAKAKAYVDKNRHET